MLTIISFSYKRVHVMVIVNITVYKRIQFIRVHVTYRYVIILYVHMYINARM